MSAVPMQKVKSISVKFFGPLKDFFGGEKIIEIKNPRTVQDILDQFVMEKKESENLLRASRAAVGDEFVKMDLLLEGDEELLFLPPASGG